jgi:Domain of unknown function (DUF151)
VNGKDPHFEEIDVDARPSDAINLAVRCRAPIYIAKDIAAKMAGSVPPVHVRERVPQNRKDIVASCRAALSAYEDPTTFLKLDMQLAVAVEDYNKAAKWVLPYTLDGRYTCSADAFACRCHICLIIVCLNYKLAWTG